MPLSGSVDVRPSSPQNPDNHYRRGLPQIEHSVQRFAADSDTSSGIASRIEPIENKKELAEQRVWCEPVSTPFPVKQGDNREIDPFRATSLREWHKYPGQFNALGTDYPIARNREFMERITESLH